jgi:hypothetical protein
MRRRNLNEEYLNSVRSSDGKSAHSSVTLEHTTEASAGFAQLLRQQKRGGGSKDANVIDIGPRKSIFAALNAHSNSLFGNSSDAFFDENNDDAREGAYHLGWRTFIAAAVLLVIGIILLVVGLRVYLKSNSDSVHNGLEMIVLGCVLFLPGLYAGSIMLGTQFGWVGYHYGNLPSYDPFEENDATLQDQTSLLSNRN